MDVRRRDLITGLVACAGGVVRPAWGAPHTQPLSLRQLVDASELVADAVAEPLDSTWAHVFGARRVVTFWRLSVGAVIAGQPAASAAVVTLGGTVGDVQQWVPHEAELIAGQRHVVFLRRGPLSRYWVTGMLQGAYELTSQGTSWRVRISPTQRDIATPGSAITRLAGLEVAGASRLIVGEWES